MAKTNFSSVDVDDHDGSTAGLYLNDTLITSTAAELNIMDGVTATAAEINDAADVGANAIVNVTASTLAVTAVLHAGKIVTLNRAAGVTVTLPAATGTANVYTFIIGTAASTNANIIETSAGTEHMAGSLRSVDDDADTGLAWNADTSDDTITMDGTATGGKIGDMIIVRDYAATIFSIDGHITQSGGAEVTPFSAAV